MNEIWPYDSIHDYLARQGMIPDGSELEISNAKKMYWKHYHTFHQRLRRKERTEFTIHFGKSIARELEQVAKAQNCSVPEYIKRNILDVLEHPVNVKAPITSQTLQLLSQAYSDIQNLIRNHLSSTPNDVELYSLLLDKIQRMEELIDNEVWS